MSAGVGSSSTEKVIFRNYTQNQLEQVIDLALQKKVKDRQSNIQLVADFARASFNSAEEIARLGEQVTDLQERIETLKKEAQQSLVEKETEITRQQEAAKKSQLQMVALQTQLTQEKEASAAAAEEKERQHTESARQLQEQVAEYQRQNDDVKKEAADARSKAEQLGQETESRRHELEKAQEEIRTLTQNLEKTSQELSQVRDGADLEKLKKLEALMASVPDEIVEWAERYKHLLDGAQIIQKLEREVAFENEEMRVPLDEIYSRIQDMRTFIGNLARLLSTGELFEMETKVRDLTVAINDIQLIFKIKEDDQDLPLMDLVEKVQTAVNSATSQALAEQIRKLEKENDKLKKEKTLWGTFSRLLAWSWSWVTGTVSGTWHLAEKTMVLARGILLVR